MNREHVIEFIKNPHKIDAAATQEIEQVLAQYPYFQTAHLLFVKGLKNHNSIHLPDRLKLTATYAGDRSILFSLLHDSESLVDFAPEDISAENVEAESQEAEQEVKQEEILPAEDNTPDFAAQEVEVEEKESTPENNVAEDAFAQEPENMASSLAPENEEKDFTEHIHIPSNEPDSSLKNEEEPQTFDEHVAEEEQTALINADEQKLEPLELEPQVSHEPQAVEDIEDSQNLKDVDETKEEPSLADVILQRLQEIKERDAQKENAVETSVDAEIHNESVEPTPQLQDKDETQEQVYNSEEENVVLQQEIDKNEKQQAIDGEEKQEQKKPNDSLLDFCFDSGMQEVEDEKENQSAIEEEKTPVHATSMWFEQTELSKDELDASNPIDAFIVKQQSSKQRYKMQEKKEESEPSDISSESIKEGEYLSETLAKIYIAQKNYTKAIQIYQKLSLKYPQKSIYFANQISEIEKLK